MDKIDKKNKATLDRKDKIELDQILKEQIGFYIIDNPFRLILNNQNKHGGCRGLAHIWDTFSS